MRRRWWWKISILSSLRYLQKYLMSFVPSMFIFQEEVEEVEEVEATEDYYIYFCHFNYDF